MTHVTLMTLIDAVADTLRDVTVLMPGEAAERPFTVQSYDELSEAIQDLPTVQVYPTDAITDTNGTTDRTTLQIGVQHTALTLTLRCFARQRSNLNDDMAAAVACWDALDAALEGVGIGCKPFFDASAIKGFRWETTLATFDYAKVAYVGCEVTLTLEVF
jgi:hypothetical protein